MAREVEVEVEVDYVGPRLAGALRSESHHTHAALPIAAAPCVTASICMGRPTISGVSRMSRVSTHPIRPSSGLAGDDN